MLHPCALRCALACALVVLLDVPARCSLLAFVQWLDLPSDLLPLEDHPIPPMVTIHAPFPSEDVVRGRALRCEVAVHSCVAHLLDVLAPVINALLCVGDHVLAEGAAVFFGSLGVVAVANFVDASVVAALLLGVCESLEELEDLPVWFIGVDHLLLMDKLPLVEVNLVALVLEVIQPCLLCCLAEVRGGNG